MGTIRERKTGKGKIVYDVSVRRFGERPLYRAFARKIDARDWMQEMETSLKSGEQFARTEAQRHRLSEAIDRFILEELPKKPKMVRDQSNHLLWFKKRAGSKFLSEVNPALLTQLKGECLREKTRYKTPRKPQSWNRYLSSLSCVLQYCANDWEWMETNPARRVRREKEAPGRIRFLSTEEREALLAACKQSTSKNLYPLVLLALSTGMRRGEVRNLTWDQIDLNKGVILLSQTKNGDRRRVPVSKLALETLREHSKVRRIDTNLIFPGETGKARHKPFALDKYWYKAMSEAGIMNFRFHDLRHSCASYLAMNGASLLQISEILGHRTVQMVKRYSHFADSEIADVLERMNRKIFGE